jgi:hypothetical protein
MLVRDCRDRGRDVRVSVFDGVASVRASTILLPLACLKLVQVFVEASEAFFPDHAVVFDPI